MLVLFKSKEFYIPLILDFFHLTICIISYVHRLIYVYSLCIVFIYCIVMHTALDWSYFNKCSILFYSILYNTGY